MTYGGTYLPNWTPQGTGTNYQLSPILQPLERHRAKTNVLSGMWNATSSRGHVAAVGTIAQLPRIDYSDSPGTLPTGPSLDQIIADHIRAEGVHLPFHSLFLAVGDLARGSVREFNERLVWDSNLQTVDPDWDANIVHDRLFSELTTPDPTTPGEETRRQRLEGHRPSVVDSVLREYHSVRRRLGVADQHRLDQHMDHLRTLENEYRMVEQGGGSRPTHSCRVPPLDNVLAGWGNMSRIARQELDRETFRAMIDATVMALACDLTRVVVIQHINGSESQVPGIIPGGASPNIHEHHHYQTPGILTDVGTYYSEQVAYLLDGLDAVDEGNGSLLDNSCVVHLSEFGDGDAHHSGDLPIVQAGGLAGTFHTGAHHHYPNGPWPWGVDHASDSDMSQGTSIGRLYTSIQNAFGVSGNWANAPFHAPLVL